VRLRYRWLNLARIRNQSPEVGEIKTYSASATLEV
jgi:hypothetical protein